MFKGLRGAEKTAPPFYAVNPQKAERSLEKGAFLVYWGKWCGVGVNVRGCKLSVGEIML